MGCFALIVFLVSCGYFCSVTFLRDVVGWSAMCDYGTSCFYSFNIVSKWKGKSLKSRIFTYYNVIHDSGSQTHLIIYH